MIRARDPAELRCSGDIHRFTPTLWANSSKGISMRIRLVRSFVPALALAMLPVASFAGVSVGVSITLAPPALPVYVQPAPPAADYIWTPGYWAWGDDDYYWVPGTWVLAPTPGYLWTPGYWGWESGVYLWHGGYWGPHVGFYGGVNYGFGYGGVGFQGGYWRGGHVVYNRSVTNVTNINVTNVYNKTVVVHNVNHVSFNGGAGGISARPTAREEAASHDRHLEFTAMQRQHAEMAAGNRDLRASVNGGRPRIAATARPTSFSGRGVVAARAAGGPVHSDRPGPVAHAGDHGPADHGAADHGQGDHGPAHPGGPGSAGPGPAQHAAPRTDRPSHAAQPNMHPTGQEPHAAPSHGAPRPDSHAQGDRPQAQHRAAPQGGAGAGPGAAAGPGGGGHPGAGNPGGGHPGGERGPQHEAGGGRPSGGGSKGPERPQGHGDEHGGQDHR